MSSDKRTSERKQLESLVESAMRDPPEKVSAKKIAAVTEYSLKLYKRYASEVVDVLLNQIMSCDASKRLIAVYIIDAVIMRSHKKMGPKSYPKLFEKKLRNVFELVTYSSSSDKRQIGKVLGKWRDRKIYEEHDVVLWAQTAMCALPKAGELALPVNSPKQADVPESEQVEVKGKTRWDSEPATKEAKRQPNPPSDPPPIPRPPPVTLSLNISKKAQDYNGKSNSISDGKEDGKVQQNPESSNDASNRFENNNSFSASSNATGFNVTTATDRGNSFDSSGLNVNATATPNIQPGGWGKFISHSQNTRGDDTVVKLHSGQSIGWGRWGAGSGALSPQLSVDEQQKSRTWGGFGTISSTQSSIANTPVAQSGSNFPVPSQTGAQPSFQGSAQGIFQGIVKQQQNTSGWSSLAKR